MVAFDPTRPCGTKTRAPGRYTRKELDDIALAYGIQGYKQMTMDDLCDVLKKRNSSKEQRSGTSYTDSSRREEPPPRPKNQSNRPRNQPSTSTNTTPVSKDLDVMHMLGNVDAETLSIELFVRLYLRIHPWLMLGATDSTTATKNFRKMSLKIHPDKCHLLECKLAMKELTCSLSDASLNPPSLYDRRRSITTEDREEALKKLQELKDIIFREENPPPLTAIQRLKQESRRLGVPENLLKGVDRQTLEDLIREYQERANGTWKNTSRNGKNASDNGKDASSNDRNGKNGKNDKNASGNGKNNRNVSKTEIQRKKKSMAWFRRLLQAAAVGILGASCLRPRVRK